MGSCSSALRPKKQVRRVERVVRVRIDQQMFAEITLAARQLLETKRSELGPEHPDTLSQMHQVAVLLCIGGRLADAEHDFRQLLPLMEKVHGPNHVDTITVLDDLSGSLCGLKKYEESIRLRYVALERSESAFGPEHDLTIKVLRNLGIVYMRQGNPYLATSVLIRAEELSKRLFGPEHPTTLGIASDLTAAGGTPDSLELRRALAAQHGLPMPGDPFANVVSAAKPQMLSSHERVSGAANGGPEAANVTAMQLARISENKVVVEPQRLSQAGEIAGPSNAAASSSNLGSAASQPFRSLVERSIHSLAHLHGSGRTSGAVNKHAEALRKLGSLDEFLRCRDHLYWFFQRREAFMRQAAFQKWHPVRLDDYVLLPMGDVLVNETDCVFISHYWHEHGDPHRQGEGLRAVQQRVQAGFWPEAAYFWVDYTCLPQSERTKAQEEYFARALVTIPRLVRDCGLTWHFPDFLPRLWVLFEVAEFTCSRSEPIPLSDMLPYMSHLREMKTYGVKYVLNMHGYRCAKQSDRELVTGWMELLVILTRIVPSIRTRRIILDAIDSPTVRTCHHEELHITVDKLKGTVTMRRTTYEFTPLPSEATGPKAHIHIGPDSYYENELPKALQRARLDDLGYERTARDYDREGEHKIAEALHRKNLADKQGAVTESALDVAACLGSLAENLQKQGRYGEAEDLHRHEVAMLENEYGPSDDLTLKGRDNLVRAVHKHRLATYHRYWEVEPLERIVGNSCPVIPETGPGNARILESGETAANFLEEGGRLAEAEEMLWTLLKRRKEILGPFHPRTLTTLCDLGRVLRVGKKPADAEKVLWLALAVSDDLKGPESLSSVSLMNNIAAAMRMQGKPAQAREIYRQELERRLASVEFAHPDLFTVKFELTQALDDNEQLRVAGTRVELRPSRR